MDDAVIEKAKEHFGRILHQQLQRVKGLSAALDWIDYGSLHPLKIGILAGDGIGPYITAEARRVLEFLFAEDVKAGKIVINDITGLTIENRAAHMQTIPGDVLAEIKEHDVTLKGPTYTPRKGDAWPNLESCNVAMRKELDLFANVRPVRIPTQQIDWAFFRENTEDLYALGPYGLDVNEDVSIDFRIISTPGADRICRLAFEYAKKNARNRVTCVTKANIIKTTDGRFLDSFYRIAKEYPGIQADDWYIDIMTAKIVDEKRRREFQVVVLPNLYGDILTDEAAELQGGVGTAGSANIGKRYAMFEAIHGSAPRMVEEKRAEYADPASMIRATSMLVSHIGYPEKSRRLDMALDICGQYEKKLAITGRSNGASGREYTDYILDWFVNPRLRETWEQYTNVPR